MKGMPGTEAGFFIMTIFQQLQFELNGGNPRQILTGDFCGCIIPLAIAAFLYVYLRYFAERKKNPPKPRFLSTYVLFIPTMFLLLCCAAVVFMTILAFYIGCNPDPPAWVYIAAMPGSILIAYVCALRYYTFALENYLKSIGKPVDKRPRRSTTVYAEILDESGRRIGRTHARLTSKPD
jgi:hypothetical protein